MPRKSSRQFCLETVQITYTI